MDIDDAKENIQPLACGQDAKCLAIAINDEEEKQLLRQKNEYEEKIQNYCGNDPLEIWFEYISWVEQYFPKSGKEYSIDDLLKKCLIQFGDKSKYFQDSRFVKIYIKFIDTQENPIEIYQELYNHGIGTMISDFYIAWAYYYDLMDNFNKANEIFVKGIDARAQPLEALEHAQKTFSLSIPARLLNRNENDKRKIRETMEEKRQALTSLRADRHTHIGSLRTMVNVIKFSKFGKLSSSNSHTSNHVENRVVNVFRDTSKESDDLLLGLCSQRETSITHNLIDKASDKEYKNELGLWPTSNKNQDQNVIPSTNASLAFSLLEDLEDKTNYKLGEAFAIKLPSNFKRSNLPQSENTVPLFISESRPFTLPMYDKIMIYPGTGDEYSPEELKAWKYLKKMNVRNQFVIKYDQFWTTEGLATKARIPPNFPNKNQKQTEFITEPPPKVLPTNQRIYVRGWKHYDYSEDLTVEDFLAKKWYSMNLKNKTVLMNMSLDETEICCADNSVIMIDESNFIIEEEHRTLGTPTPSPAAKKLKKSLGEKHFACDAFKLKCEDEQYGIVKNTAKSTYFDLTDVPKPVFQIFTDENVSVNQDIPIPDTELPISDDNIEPIKMQTNFKIFEDNNEVVFKEPQHTGTIKRSIAKPQPGQEVIFENGFTPEETFSTQNFVMFIKQQETSTPIKQKRDEMDILEVSEESKKTEIIPALPIKLITEVMSSPESVDIPKQLSVILEISETNTGGSSGNGTNPKSSLEENNDSFIDFKLGTNCINPAKSKTINNGHYLSTIHEGSCSRDPSVKDTSQFSPLKLTEDSVRFPKYQKSKQIEYEVDVLCKLFSRTPEKNVKNSSRMKKSELLKSFHTSPKSKIHNNSEEELLEFFNKSPQPFRKLAVPTTSIVLNDSVTIPSFKDVLLTNSDNTAITTNANMGSSMAMPKNQSIIPDFTENISIFTNNQKSKINSLTITTKFQNDENSDLIQFSTQKSQYSIFEQEIYEPREMINDDDNLDDEEWLEDGHSFHHKIIDMNQTRQQIDNCFSAENIDPWNSDLCNAFLEDMNFFNYLESRNDCTLINIVPSLKGRNEIQIANKEYNSLKYIAKGAFGYIYKGKDMATNKMVVLKQERPPNCWEYYISLIITERIIIDHLPRFMVIDTALIGNNSSILVSDYVEHGTLIDICNKVYASTSRHIDELIVMVLAIELFTIVDILHSADIIHGDIKPDNFLLISTLSLDSKLSMLKLIDYGNSIDMKRFTPNTAFRTAIKTEDFVCSEMTDGRQWTYQTDLYCLAGTLHVLLFGQYMKTENKLGKINIVTKLPRYFHKTAWERIFTSLLNVPDCQTFPNLQDFKLDLKEILAEKEQLALEKISSFNRIIHNH